MDFRAVAFYGPFVSSTEMRTKFSSNQKLQILFFCAILTVTITGAICYRTILVSSENEIAQTKAILTGSPSLLIFAILAVLWVVTALWALKGKLREFSEFTQDLTDSAASEARYRGLLEAAADAMVVVNPEGDIVLLNVQAEKQFGYCRDELVGQKVTNIIPEGFAERLVADDLRSAAEALAQQIGTGIELSARRKDGSEFPIEIMLSPLESAEGILVTAAIRDISSRKKAERYLARMKARYRGLLEAAPRCDGGCKFYR